MAENRTKDLTKAEQRVIHDELWEQIISDLDEEVTAIYEQASEIWNLKSVAHMVGPRTAIDEVLDCLRIIDTATKQAKQVAVAHASTLGYSDLAIARRVGANRRSVRRWIEEHQEHEEEQALTQEQVDELNADVVFPSKRPRHTRESD